MDLQKLQRVVVDALEDVKAHDIKVYNTIGLSDMFDRVILASGTSNRQSRALAWSVVGKVKEAGGQVISVEGTDPGEQRVGQEDLEKATHGWVTHFSELVIDEWT